MVVDLLHALQRQMDLIFVEQHLDQHIPVVRTLAIEHYLEIGSHGENAIVGPSATVQRLEVICCQSIVFNLEQAYQRQKHRLVTIAQLYARLLQSDAAVSLFDDAAKQVALGVRLKTTIEG